MSTESEATVSNGDRQVAAAAGPGRHRARAYVFAVASVALAVACILLALKYFVAERLPDLTEATLQAATDRWSERGPADYDMDIDLRGARPGNVHVEVRNGAVTAQTRDGRVPGRWT